MKFIAGDSAETAIVTIPNGQTETDILLGKLRETSFG